MFFSFPGFLFWGGGREWINRNKAPPPPEQTSNYYMLLHKTWISGPGGGADDKKDKLVTQLSVRTQGSQFHIHLYISRN